MCLYPKLIKNRKYIANKKNKGVIPKVTDPRVLYVPVKCGKCMECMKANSREWKIRLQEEIRTDKTGQFVTLSFSDESLLSLGEGIELEGYNLDNEIARKAVRRFLERWRKKFKKSVKHWLITELGQTNTERLHIHGLLFTGESTETIEKIWKYGNVWIGQYVNERTINYIVKYLYKQDGKHKFYKPKKFCTAGIGKGYTERRDSQNNKFREGETNECYRFRNGGRSALPVYYRNKIYTEDERERLWLEKLDKQERWVDGARIDISNGEEAYYNRLELARDKNKRLGFGDDKIDWDRKKYEQRRRYLLKKDRIAKNLGINAGSTPKSVDYITLYDYFINGHLPDSLKITTETTRALLIDEIKNAILAVELKR